MILVFPANEKNTTLNKTKTNNFVHRNEFIIIYDEMHIWEQSKKIKKPKKKFVEKERKKLHMKKCIKDTTTIFL